MPFINKKKNERASHKNKKIQPIGAWGNYSRAKRIGPSELTGEKNIIINVDKLSLSYDGREVVKGVDFTVREGDYLCIIGENGTGKTTLMNALLGLKRADGGKIEFLDGLSRTDIGFLPQHTEVQVDFPASVSEIVTSGCLMRGNRGFFFGKKEKQIAFDNMEKLGITSLASRSYKELSGGQQQRVLLARALCASSRVLMLDEPVTALDPRAKGDMYSLINDINRRDGMTVVMISHDINTVLKYATRVLYLGRSDCFFGSREEFLADERGSVYNKADGQDDTVLYGNSDAYKYNEKGNGEKDI